MTPAAPRPKIVTAIAILFIAVGVVGILYHARELGSTPFWTDGLWVLLVRMLAIVAGICLLKGANWARWLAIAWLAFHVILSIWHSPAELVMHVAFLVVIAYLLVGTRAATYFTHA